MSEWRHIDTAPKDGSDILIFSQKHGRRVARYEPFQWGKSLEWFIGLEQGWCGGTYDCAPTHWMPLPPPPSSIICVVPDRDRPNQSINTLIDPPS